MHFREGARERKTAEVSSEEVEKAVVERTDSV